MGNSVLRRRALLQGAVSSAAILAASPVLGASRTGPGGFARDGLKRLSQGMQGLVDAGHEVGTVTLVYRRGAIAQVDAVGWRDLETKAPMRRDTIFRIASMSKPITSVATLQLVEQGKLELDAPIDRWLPELANRRVLNRPDGASSSSLP